MMGELRFGLLLHICQMNETVPDSLSFTLEQQPGLITQIIFKLLFPHPRNRQLVDSITLSSLKNMFALCDSIVDPQGKGLHFHHFLSVNISTDFCEAIHLIWSSANDSKTQAKDSLTPSFPTSMNNRDYHRVLPLCTSNTKDSLTPGYLGMNNSRG